MTLEKYQMTNLGSENTLGVQQKSATRAPLMMPMGKTARKIDLHPIMRDARERERELAVSLPLDFPLQRCVPENTHR
jgi:hypothetical protein